MDVPSKRTAPPSRAGVALTRGAMRLQILQSLPPRLQNFVFTETRKRCASNAARHHGISADELLSEGWSRFLMSGSLSGEDDGDANSAATGNATDA